jgi:hypothetical protein
MRQGLKVRALIKKLPEIDARLKEARARLAALEEEIRRLSDGEGRP